jgi:hypothetical protein
MGDFAGANEIGGIIVLGNGEDCNLPFQRSAGLLKATIAQSCTSIQYRTDPVHGFA